MKLDARLTTLPNGFRLATVRMPQVDSVAMGFWVGVGGRHEPARLNGISHYIEHLLFKGTKTRSARAISQAVEGCGGYFDAYTQEDLTCYFARVAANHTHHVLDVLEDMYRNPRFAPADIEREREVILEEISMYRDQPAQRLEDLSMLGLWPDHPLGRQLTGTEASLRRIQRPDLIRYKDLHYTPGTTVLAVAGRVDHDDMIRRVSPWASALPRVRHMPMAPAGRAPKPRRILAEEMETDQVHLSLAFRCFGRKDRRRLPLKLMSVILGENMSSRLFQIIRERHGLAYTVSSHAQLYDDTGYFAVEAGLDAEKFERALELILKELRSLARRGPGAAELRRAKDYSTGQFVLGMENTSNVMGYVGEQFLLTHRFKQPVETMDALRKVEGEAIRQVARDVLNFTRTSLALVAPKGSNLDHARLQRLLRRYV